MSLNRAEHLAATIERLTARQNARQADIWTFDSPEIRTEAATLLRQDGIEARIRSAYKPLVFAFIEEVIVEEIVAISVHYPTVIDVPPTRFHLECYPVTDLVAPRPVSFIAKPPVSTAGLLTYDVILRSDSGEERITVAAPNKFVVGPAGERVLANIGWLRATTDDGSVSDGPIETDFQQAYDQALALVRNLQTDGVGQGRRIDLRIATPVYDHPLPVEHEHISTAEALHEDVYFSGVEALGVDRPGQIAPDIIPATTTDVSLTSTPVAVERSRGGQQLAAAPHCLTPSSIKFHLDQFNGEPYQARSQQGRPVWGSHIAGPGLGVVISAAQHGNETAGVIGGLRAAEQCRRMGTNVAISPLENPDGYALYEAYRCRHPTHMHHAARFTAAGCDLEDLDGANEAEIRVLGRAKTNAALHLNLHGYPAHEWTRPLSGYIPRGYEDWTIPKGFFLILRSDPDWAATANRILDAVVTELAADDQLVAFNRQQIDRYRRYLPDAPLEVRDHIPVFLAEQKPGALFPITLITESPDEGLEGDPYVLMHTAHMKAVVAAVAAHTGFAGTGSA